MKIGTRVRVVGHWVIMAFNGESVIIKGSQDQRLSINKYDLGHVDSADVEGPKNPVEDTEFILAEAAAEIRRLMNRNHEMQLRLGVFDDMLRLFKSGGVSTGYGHKTSVLDVIEKKLEAIRMDTAKEKANVASN